MRVGDLLFFAWLWLYHSLLFWPVRRLRALAYWRPLAAEDLTERFLSEGFGVNVHNFTLEPLTGGATSRIWRLHLQWTSAVPPMSRELIVKELRCDNQMLFIGAAVHPLGARECAAYRDLAPHLGSLMPRCHYAGHCAWTQQTLLILEDLNAPDPAACAAIAAPDRNAGVEFPARIERAAFTAARIHQLTAHHVPAHFYEPARTNRTLDMMPLVWAQCKTAGTLRGHRNLSEFLDHFTARRTHLERLYDAMVDPTAWPGGGHVDARLANFFYSKERGPAFVDWAGFSAGSGPGRDLAWLLCFDSEPSERRDLQEKLCQTMATVLDVPMERVFANYRLGLLWTALMIPFMLQSLDVTSDAPEARQLAHLVDRVTRNLVDALEDPALTLADLAAQFMMLERVD